jgi:enoyl-CoA hydratase/carnithine racemase
MALHLDAARLRQLLESPLAAEELSAVNGIAALVVDLDGDRGGALDERLLAVPCVTVGRHHRSPPAVEPSVGSWFDVLLGPDDGELLDAILAAVETHPIAAAALAILLRGSERRSIAEGLAAESAVYSLLQAGPEFAAWRAGRAPTARAAAPAPVVRIARHDATLQVTLDRPARHNAFDRQMRDELIEALALAAADPTIRRVVLRGAGPSFCSGGDLDEFGSFPDPATAHVVRLTRSAAQLAARLAPRLEVHLHGACLGAGIELPAFAGRIVADPDAVIGLPELGLGLVPGAGGTVSLPRRIGRQRTALLALSGRSIDAPTALAWGLVDVVDRIPASGRG